MSVPPASACSAFNTAAAASGLTISVVVYQRRQIGLQRNRATRFDPILNPVSMLAAVTLGIVVFGQKLGRPALYLLALAATLTGLTLLSAPGKQTATPP